MIMAENKTPVEKKWLDPKGDIRMGVILLLLASPIIFLIIMCISYFA